VHVLERKNGASHDRESEALLAAAGWAGDELDESVSFKSLERPVDTSSADGVMQALDEYARGAGNIAEFHHELRAADLPVLEHHLRQGDFSLWIEEVIGDGELAARVRTIERWHRTDSRGPADTARRGIITALEYRYPDAVE
jgi:hypothetical protein